MPRSLGPAFDLLAAYRPPDGAFVARAGVGVVATRAAGWVPADRAVEALRARRGAVAIGALGFEGDRPLLLADAAIRRRVRGRAPVLLGDPTPPVEPVRGRRPAAAFAEPQLREHPAPDDYAAAVRVAVERIRAGGLRKVVLARTIEVRAGRPLDARLLLHRLRAVEPDAYAFAVPADGGVLVGASPELLVARQGLRVRANPLAGSAPRAADASEDRAIARALARSAKDREEHAIVVEAVAAALGPLCRELRWDPTPRPIATANVWHLSTRFVGTLREPGPSALDLARALHPTPAVGGEPAAAALAAIEALEPFDRGAYAGPVGWVDGAGDGVWAIALRCALLVGERATLYAGAGIVAASDPAAELAETDRKFRAFLDALRWG
ncbi:MAG: putative isochorismate synthase MenF [Actinomycetota bacterium]|jgi:isochorismate synthase|nr:MAG: putative isochorismate synthase MenF [Actinomycetota bacterium]